MSAIILATIFGICAGKAECIESLKDLYPQIQGEVVLAWESIYFDGAGQCR